MKRIIASSFIAVCLSASLSYAQNIGSLPSAGPGPAPSLSWIPQLPSGANVGALIVNGAGNQPAAINSVASGAVLASGGVGSTPAFTTTPTLSSISVSGYIGSPSQNTGLFVSGITSYLYSNSGQALVSGNGTRINALAANTTTLTVFGNSITGSSSVTPGISITGTLNTTGVVDGAALFANITNTASGNGTMLLDLQVNGSSKFSVDLNGNVGIGALLDVNGPARLSHGYLVSTLPAAGTAGRRAYVTDQLTACVGAGAALTGGGSVACPVFDNGSAWVGD